MDMKKYQELALRTAPEPMEIALVKMPEKESEKLLDILQDQILPKIMELGTLLDYWKRAAIYGEKSRFLHSNPPGFIEDQIQRDFADYLHGTIGLFTEACENCEHLASVMQTRNSKIGLHIPDDVKLRVGMKEEGGDALWYITVIARALGVGMDDMAEDNIVKLQKRYKEKFTVEEAINRDTENELSHIK